MRKMKESKEVKTLRSKLLGMELELNLLSKDLERFNFELIYNEKMLKITLENLDFLKTSNAAISLTEYKKIKQQKKLIEMRIKYYKQKIQPLEQMLNRKEDNHKKEMERFEYLYRMQFKNNILEFPCDRRKKA
jgi:hypothetical protein